MLGVIESLSFNVHISTFCDVLSEFFLLIDLSNTNYFLTDKFD